MAPFPLCHLFGSCNPTLGWGIARRMSVAEHELRTQWRSPSDILSLLLILGPEVVQRALAQVAGTRYVPIGFSFGWTAYSINALITIVGEGRLMPISDFPAIVINASTGHTRDNKAWIIGRLLRDFEKSTGPLSSDKASQEWEALRVSVFKWDENREQGRPARDWLWYSGFAVIVLQISISIIPLTLLSEWATLVFVMGGIILASAQAALPQWGLEKWACPRHGATVSITRGNGYRHVMVLLGSPNALDMEVLASGSKGEEQHPITKAAVAVLAALWAVLLITIAGLKQGSWYLVAIGAIGMIQNIIVVGSPRSPSAFGMHINCIHTIKASKVSKALLITEQYYPGVGASLIPIFNPGGFRVPKDEADFWERVNTEGQASKPKRHNAEAAVVHISEPEAGHTRP